MPETHDVIRGDEHKSSQKCELKFAINTINGHQLRCDISPQVQLLQQLTYRIARIVILIGHIVVAPGIIVRLNGVVAGNEVTRMSYMNLLKL